MSDISTSAPNESGLPRGPRLPLSGNVRVQQQLGLRYTRFVGMMKLLLPMIGLGLIVAVLQKHRQHPDAAVRQAVEEAIRALGSAAGAGG